MRPRAKSRRGRVAGLLRDAALFAAVCLACLLGGEWVVRKVAPQDLIRPSRKIWRPDETIGWRHVENTEASINTGERKVKFFTDGDGYRIGTPGSSNDSDSAIKVLVIGDSFVEATAVEYDRSFAGILESLLRRHTGAPVRVVNDGVGGWDPNQYLTEARIALARHPYSLGIVCLYVGNDLVSERRHAYSADVVANRHHFRWPRSISSPELKDAVLYPVNDIFMTRSQLFVLFKNASNGLRRRLGIIPPVSVPQIFQTSAKSSGIWSVTSDIAGDIEARFRERGIPVLFVLLPTTYQVYPDSWNEWLRSSRTPADSADLEQPNRLLSEGFESRGLILHDALEFLRQRAGEDEQLYGKVDRHFSPAGHEAMADYLLQVVVESGALE